MARLKHYLKRIITLFMKPEMGILPGQLAYFIIMAIFPFLALLGYMISKITIISSFFISATEALLPKSVINVLSPFIANSSLTGNVALVMIIGLILVSNGTHSIIIASDEIFGIKWGDYVKRRVKAFFMIFILIFLFIFVTLVLAYGNVIINKIMALDFLKDYKSNIYFIFMILKWPVAFILLFIILKFLYAIAPDEQIPSMFMTKGSIFTSLGWIISTSCYSYYVSNIANYTLFYGSLSSVIILMIWIYLLSFIFVMGMAINAEEYAVYKKEQKVHNK